LWEGRKSVNIHANSGFIWGMSAREVPHTWQGCSSIAHRHFEEHGWDIVFSFAPNAKFDSAVGEFTTNDGLLTVTNLCKSLFIEDCADAQ
jgi:hypothetical protein